LFSDNFANVLNNSDENPIRNFREGIAWAGYSTSPEYLLNVLEVSDRLRAAQVTL